MQFDQIVRSDYGRGKLGEDDRRRGLRDADLAAMVPVVEPDADDLARVPQRGDDLHVPGGPPRRDPVGRARQPAEAVRVGGEGCAEHVDGGQRAPVAERAGQVDNPGLGDGRKRRAAVGAHCGELHDLLLPGSGLSSADLSSARWITSR